MVKKFFWIKRQTVDEHNDSAAAHNNDPQIMLLSGPPSCGKTSLLFQFAVNTVLEQGRNVVFICNKRRLEKKPPFLSQGLDPSSDIFTRIQIKYVEDDEGIKKYFAAIHMHCNNEGGTFPGVVIIDDFGEFFDDTNCKQRYGGRDASGSYVLNNITRINGASIISSTGATTEALASIAESVAGRKKTAGCAKFSIAPVSHVGRYLLAEK
ncbi:hypothetical protein MKX03_036120 [Papaver bracteatum]|nr:hypothetical protein MKX03_036120 [Papaver bracteatum]